MHVTFDIAIKYDQMNAVRKESSSKAALSCTTSTGMQGEEVQGHGGGGMTWIGFSGRFIYMHTSVLLYLQTTVHMGLAMCLILQHYLQYVDELT